MPIFPPNFTDVWDVTQPPDTQLANLLGQDIRNLKLDIMQRLSLLSGLYANLPTPETVNASWGGAGYGLLYFATDTNQILQWNGTSWVDVTASIVKTQPPINNAVNALLAADTALPNNTPVSLITQAVVFPSTGGPWRVIINYGVYLSLSGAQPASCTCYVNDGTTPMATSCSFIGAGGIGTFEGGVSGGQISPDYANSATVTFTLIAQQSNTGSVSVTAKKTPAVGAQNSYLTLAVIGSS